MRTPSPRFIHAVLLGALLLAAIAALTMVALQSLTHGMQEALGRQEQLRTQAMAERLDGVLAARRLALATLSEALPGPVGRSAAMLQQALAAQGSLSGAFLNVALFARNGELVYSARPPVSRLYATGTRPYFIEAVLQKRELLSQPFTSALTGTPVVVFARPLLDAQGQVEYVLAASLALAEAPMSLQAEGDGRLSYVMTTDGFLVSYPQRARLTRHVNEVPELNPEVTLGLHGFQGWRLADDSSRVTAFARLRQAPWIIGLQTPEPLVFGSLAKAREHLIYAAGVIAALALALAWPLSRLTTRNGLHAAPASAPPQAARTPSAADPAAAATPAVASAISPAAMPSGTSAAASITASTMVPTIASRPAASPPSIAGPGTGPVPPPVGAILAEPEQPPTSTLSSAAARAHPSVPELDLDAFMQANFTSDEQRLAFIFTVSASVRKLAGEVDAVGDAIRTTPVKATGILHTLKGAWGSLGAREFARSAAALESAIKMQQATDAPRAEFEQHATQLRAEVEAWLASHETAPVAQQAAAPSADLLPLLRNRNIGAATLYESSRSYWDKLLGADAGAFAAAMDSLDFESAERLLAGVCTQAVETQRS